MTSRFFFVAMLASCVSSTVWSCPLQQRVQVTGDVPAAISYDVFAQMYPLDARKLANFVTAGQVRLVPDGTQTCLVANDGVADPSAALVDGPEGKMAFWLRAANLRSVSIPSPSH